MAPRSAKAKKAVDVKVAENDAPKKGRGKGKQVADLEPQVVDEDLDDKPVPEKKANKRGNKAINDDQASEKNTETAVPAKKGRKKKVEEVDSEDKSNGDQSADESSGQAEEVEEIDEDLEANGHTDKAAATGRGRKKVAKSAAEKPEPKSSRGRKNAKQEEKPEEVDEKPKSGRGRGQKAKVETEQDEGSEGRKKGKAASEKIEEEDEDVEPEEQDKPEPKKKETKLKKGKKGQAKEEAEEVEEEESEEEKSSSKKKKVTKKEEKTKDEEEVDSKPVKGKRGQKKAVESEKEPQESTESVAKRRRKGAEDKAPKIDKAFGLGFLPSARVNLKGYQACARQKSKSYLITQFDVNNISFTEDTKKKAPPKNKSLTDYESLNFSNESLNSKGKQWNFKISSWNVDGIRAWLTKGGLDYLTYEKPDILCLQEVKCSQEKLPSELTNVPGYHAYWLAGDKEGYAGVGIYTAQLAMNVSYGLQNEELDSEGRIITAEYEQFYLICTYVPNSGRKLVTMPKRLQWNEEFRKHVKELDKKKPVIICGDMNVSHQEIDLANPKTNRKNAGFTDEERQGMTELLGDGFIDTFRKLYPDKTGAYTFWTYMSNSRAKNVGWRLDYFVVSERLLPALCDNVIRNGVYGSDHCPLTLFLHLSSADKPKE